MITTAEKKSYFSWEINIDMFNSGIWDVDIVPEDVDVNLTAFFAENWVCCYYCCYSLVIRFLEITHYIFVNGCSIIGCTFTQGKTMVSEGFLISA